MGIYNFQARFVSMVLDGSKQHTIRAMRKHPDKPGNMLYLYTGLRQKGKSRLLLKTPCVKIESIRIYRASIVIDECELSLDEKRVLAWHDGFRPNIGEASYDDMIGFWEKQHGTRLKAFEGQIIHWRYDLREARTQGGKR